MINSKQQNIDIGPFSSKAPIYSKTFFIFDFCPFLFILLLFQKLSFLLILIRWYHLNFVYLSPLHIVPVFFFFSFSLLINFFLIFGTILDSSLITISVFIFFSGTLGNPRYSIYPSTLLQCSCYLKSWKKSEINKKQITYIQTWWWNPYFCYLPLLDVF
jgi:hypothetical protein